MKSRVEQEAAVYGLMELKLIKTKLKCILFESPEDRICATTVALVIKLRKIKKLIHERIFAILTPLELCQTRPAANFTTIKSFSHRIFVSIGRDNNAICFEKSLSLRTREKRFS